MALGVIAAIIGQQSELAKTHIRLDLENVPDIATELGHMCVAWAAVEYRVFAFYVVITGTPIALARASFYSHFNTRGRIELVLSVAEMVLQEKSEKIPELIELEESGLDVPVSQ
jgi:hypothetical protein